LYGAGKFNLAKIIFGLHVRSFALMPLVWDKMETLNSDIAAQDYKSSDFSTRPAAPFRNSSEFLTL
jgi:hypothetical protein